MRLGERTTFPQPGHSHIRFPLSRRMMRLIPERKGDLGMTAVAGGGYTTTGAILVLFILLVIISKTLLY